jgi:hypothetical protein
MRWGRVLPFAVMLTCWLHAASALAAPRVGIFENGSPPATIPGLDPSTRSAGMGGAGGAIFWGDDTSPWANPALLGMASGLRYVDGRTSILPDDVFPYVTQQTTLGYCGLGLSLSGQPFDGFGKSEITQSLGGVSGFPVSRTFERMRSWGVGASLSGVAASAAQLRHAEAPGFTRHADLAFGYTEKVVESGTTGSATSQARGVSHDMGVLARTGTTMSRGGGDAMALRLDAACGLSVLGSGNGHAGLNPIERRLRSALAARASLAHAAGWGRTLPAWLAPAFESMVSLGLAYDAEHVTHRSLDGDYDLHHYGAELGITSVLSLQLGRFESASHYAATTWGYSVTLPVGRFGGVRYAHASVPMDPVIGSESLPHRSWSAWLDPLALARAGR